VPAARRAFHSAGKGEEWGAPNIVHDTPPMWETSHLSGLAREAVHSVESRRVTDHDPAPSPNRASFVDRQVTRISNARSVTVGLALAFVALGFVGAIVMRLADPHNFPSIGLAFWWAIQTITTVGYGDHVPTTGTGRLVAGVEMVLGVSFIAFLTAGSRARSSNARTRKPRRTIAPAQSRTPRRSWPHSKTRKARSPSSTSDSIRSSQSSPERSEGRHNDADAFSDRWAASAGAHDPVGGPSSRRASRLTRPTRTRISVACRPAAVSSCSGSWGSTRRRSRRAPLRGRVRSGRRRPHDACRDHQAARSGSSTASASPRANTKRMGAAWGSRSRAMAATACSHPRRRTW
jgi:voltage-gated potassium channel